MNVIHLLHCNTIISFVNAGDAIAVIINKVHVHKNLEVFDKRFTWIKMRTSGSMCGFHSKFVAQCIHLYLCAVQTVRQITLA